LAATAQPVEIEIHPPPSPLERDRTTSAITPLPSKTSTMVPINSPNIGDSIRSSQPSFKNGPRCESRAERTMLSYSPRVAAWRNAVSRECQRFVFRRLPARPETPRSLQLQSEIKN